MDLPNDNVSNLPLNVTELPQISHLNLQSLAPIYLKVRLALSGLFFALVLIIGVVALYQTVMPLSQTQSPIVKNILWLILVLAVFNLIYIYFADQQKKYALRELDLHFSSGLIFRKTVSQPILRIQHVELKRGPVERKVGLAKLQVFSAGGAMHTFEIPGLTLKEAEAIRQFIISHKDANING
ncbi:PH domain-containing protein [Thalassotalea piscium]